MPGLDNPQKPMIASKVLVIPDGFPVHGGARIDKFVKFLPRFGWKPIVLSPREVQSPQTRELLAKLYPAWLESHYAASLGWSYFTKRFMGRGPQAQRYTLLKLLSFPERCVLVPDYMVRWVPCGIRLAAQLVAKHHIRVVLTSSPPASTHLIGLALQRWWGLRWIADFRDLWTEKKLTYRPATPLHNWWIRRLERRVMTAADHVIANTAENKDYYLRTFGLSDTYVSLIPNGFDREDLGEWVAPEKTDSVFRIGYMGNLDKHAFPWQLFFRALKMLGNKVGQENVRFIHCGWHSAEVQTYLRQHDMADLMVSYGMLPHGEAIQRIAATDLRLLLLYETAYSHSIVPAKLYSYLIMPGAVLAIAPEHGAVARILAETRTGCVLSPRRGEEAVYRLLYQYYCAWEQGALGGEPSAEHLAQYDYQTHTAQLVELLAGAS